MATQKDIARELGIATSVVSRALNPKPDRNAYVSPELRRQIREAAARLHYRPNRIAQSLRHGRPLVAGAFLPTVRSRLPGELMQGIAETAAAANLPVMFYFDYSSEAFRDFWRKALDYEHSGIITPPVEKLDRAALRDYGRKGGKIVFLDPSFYAECELPGTAFIGIDDEAGGALAAERLLARNCRHFASCGDTYKRRDGFAAALRSHGRDGRMLRTPAELPALLRELGPTAARPLGLFAETDLLALDVCNLLHRAGLTPGREVLVIGYDDLELTGQLPWPLSTVRQPFLEVGRALMRGLLDLLADRPVASCRFVPTLVARETG